MTLLELMIAMTILVMVVGALGGLARTVEQGFEYSEGYGVATQHARVVLDRIAQNVCQATANERFPGCVVLAETVNSNQYPDTLVIWHLDNPPANLKGVVPHYNELVIYCPDPKDPKKLVEIKPTDAGDVPLIDPDNMPASIAALQTAVSDRKGAATTKTVVLSSLLRSCSTLASGGGASTMRGAARFETRFRPSDTEWASYNVAYKSGNDTWANLPWVQGIYGSQAGLRQVWVRMELQLIPGVDWVESNTAAAQAIPYFGSSAMYYNLAHP